MTSKKPKIMSFAMEPEFQGILKTHAQKKGVSVSAVVRELVQKYVITEGQTTKIVLNLPNEVLGDSEKLQQWLTQKTAAIVQHFKSTTR